MESAEAYEALTAEQKQQVEVLGSFQILEDNTINNKAEQEKYNNSLAGSQVALNAAWEDFASSPRKICRTNNYSILTVTYKITLKIMNELGLKQTRHLYQNCLLKFAGLAAVWAGNTEVW